MCLSDSAVAGWTAVSGSLHASPPTGIIAPIGGNRGGGQQLLTPLLLILPTCSSSGHGLELCMDRLFSGLPPPPPPTSAARAPSQPSSSSAPAGGITGSGGGAGRPRAGAPAGAPSFHPPASGGSSSVPSFRGWTLAMLQATCVLAGCDFLPSLKGISFKTAHSWIGGSALGCALGLMGVRWDAGVCTGTHRMLGRCVCSFVAVCRTCSGRMMDWAVSARQRGAHVWGCLGGGTPQPVFRRCAQAGTAASGGGGAACCWVGCAFPLSPTCLAARCWMGCVGKKRDLMGSP